MDGLGQGGGCFAGTQEDVHTRAVDRVEGEWDLQRVGGTELAVEGPGVPGEPVHPGVRAVGVAGIGQSDGGNPEHPIGADGTRQPTRVGDVQAPPVGGQHA